MLPMTSYGAAHSFVQQLGSLLFGWTLAVSHLCLQPYQFFSQHPKHSWPLPGPWEGHWNSSSSHYFHSDDECGICLPSCCPTRLGHTTQKCVRVKAPAPGQMLSKESQKAGWKGEEFIRCPRAGGWGLSPANLNIIAELSCAQFL